jgi:hypothetical protein
MIAQGATKSGSATKSESVFVMRGGWWPNQALIKSKKTDRSVNSRRQMKTIKTRFSTTFLTVCIALAVIFGSTQRSQAAYFENYYNYYYYYLV